MDKFVEVLASIVNKVAKILDIFDFSYFVSGFTAYMLLYGFGMYVCNDVVVIMDKLPWYLAIFIIYILGLIMFAIGRCIRQGMFCQKKRKYKIFDECGFKHLSSIQKDALFCKYWDAIQNNKDDLEYYRRLWVMTAVYEGLLADLVLALILLLFGMKDYLCEMGQCTAVLIVVTVLVIFVLLCRCMYIEARKYADTIVTDLIAKNNDYFGKDICKY